MRDPIFLRNAKNKNKRIGTGHIVLYLNTLFTNFMNYLFNLIPIHSFIYILYVRQKID